MNRKRTETRLETQKSQYPQNARVAFPQLGESVSSGNLYPQSIFPPGGCNALLSQLEQFAKTMAEIIERQQHMRSEMEGLNHDLARLWHPVPTSASLTPPYESQQKSAAKGEDRSCLKRSRGLTEMQELLIASECSQQENFRRFSEDLAEYLRELCLDGRDDSHTPRIGANCHSPTPSTAQKTNCPSAVEEYNQEAAEARNRYEHLLDLDVEYEDEKFARAWRIEKGMALACSDEDFEASYRQDRIRAQERYDEGRAAAEQSWNLCKDGGFDPGPKKHLPIQQIIISSSQGSRRSRTQSPEGMVRLLNPRDRLDLFQLQLNTFDDTSLALEQHVESWMEQQPGEDWTEEHVVHSADLPTLNVRDELPPRLDSNAGGDDLRMGERRASTAGHIALLPSNVSSEVDKTNMVMSDSHMLHGQCPTCKAWITISAADEVTE